MKDERDEENLQDNTSNDIFAEEPLRNRKRKTRVDHAGSSTIIPTTMRSTPYVTKNSNYSTGGFFITKSAFDTFSTTITNDESSTTDLPNLTTTYETITDIPTTVPNFVTTDGLLEETTVNSRTAGTTEEDIEQTTRVVSTTEQKLNTMSVDLSTLVGVTENVPKEITLEDITSQTTLVSQVDTSTADYITSTLPHQTTEFLKRNNNRYTKPIEEPTSTLIPTTTTVPETTLRLDTSTPTKPELPNEATSSLYEGDVENVRKSNKKYQHEIPGRRTNVHRRVLNRTTNIGSRQRIFHLGIPRTVYPRHRATSHRGRARYRGSNRISSAPSSTTDSISTSSLAMSINDRFNDSLTTLHNSKKQEDDDLLISAATSTPFTEKSTVGASSDSSSVLNNEISRYTTLAHENTSKLNESKEESHLVMNDDTTTQSDRIEKQPPEGLEESDNIESPVNEPIAKGPNSRVPGSLKRTQLYNSLRDKHYTSPLKSLLSTTKYPTTIGHRTIKPAETTILPVTEIDGVNEASKIQITTPASYLRYGMDEYQTTESKDQSTRAQEVALSLTNLPSPKSSTKSGQLAFRETFRRKISTTVAPRKTSPSFPLSTLRQTTIYNDEPQLRVKEAYPELAISRKRRPQIIDYDYYEDEIESIVSKSTLNSKLYITSSGRIQCLDQGNFPHPLSCNKFITCAKIVNGIVIGSEYTCPDKLSFDPIGGICNWSAGLGCKE